MFIRYYNATRVHLLLWTLGWFMPTFGPIFMHSIRQVFHGSSAEKSVYFENLPVAHKRKIGNVASQFLRSSTEF